MSQEHRLSDHPTDRPIRELIQTGRPVEQGAVERILERMATAPFDPRTLGTRVRERGRSYEGRTVQSREEALFVHLVRRVLRNWQWSYGTTGQEYVDDLRRSVRSPKAQLALYHRRGGNIAATLTPTIHVVSADRRGPRSLAELWVVYSADRGIIVTGYQVLSRDEISIPEDTRWLL